MNQRRRSLMKGSVTIDETESQTLRRKSKRVSFSNDLTQVREFRAVNGAPDDVEALMSIDNIINNGQPLQDQLFNQSIYQPPMDDQTLDPTLNSTVAFAANLKTSSTPENVGKPKTILKEPIASEEPFPGVYNRDGRWFPSVETAVLMGESPSNLLQSQSSAGHSQTTDGQPMDILEAATKSAFVELSPADCSEVEGPPAKRKATSPAFVENMPGVYNSQGKWFPSADTALLMGESPDDLVTQSSEQLITQPVSVGQEMNITQVVAEDEHEEDVTATVMPMSMTNITLGEATTKGGNSYSTTATECYAMSMTNIGHVTTAATSHDMSMTNLNHLTSVDADNAMSMAIEEDNLTKGDDSRAVLPADEDMPVEHIRQDFIHQRVTDDLVMNQYEEFVAEQNASADSSDKDTEERHRDFELTDPTERILHQHSEQMDSNNHNKRTIENSNTEDRNVISTHTKQTSSVETNNENHENINVSKQNTSRAQAVAVETVHDVHVTSLTNTNIFAESFPDYNIEFSTADDTTSTCENNRSAIPKQTENNRTVDSKQTENNRTVDSNQTEKAFKPSKRYKSAYSYANHPHFQPLVQLTKCDEAPKVLQKRLSTDSLKARVQLLAKEQLRKVKLARQYTHTQTKVKELELKRIKNYKSLMEEEKRLHLEVEQTKNKHEEVYKMKRTLEKEVVQLKQKSAALSANSKEQEEKDDMIELMARFLPWKMAEPVTDKQHGHVFRVGLRKILASILVNFTMQNENNVITDISVEVLEQVESKELEFCPALIRKLLDTVNREVKSHIGHASKPQILYRIASLVGMTNQLIHELLDSSTIHGIPEIVDDGVRFDNTRGDGECVYLLKGFDISTYPDQQMEFEIQQATDFHNVPCEPNERMKDVLTEMAAVSVGEKYISKCLQKINDGAGDSWIPLKQKYLK